ncbi:MAG: glycosyltransferase family 9 protein, partial [bacterium]
PLGITSTPRFPSIRIPEVAQKVVKEKLFRFSGGSRGYNGGSSSIIIVLHPGSRGSSPRWHPIYWKELGERLWRQKGYRVIVTGSPSEKLLGEYVAGSGGENWAGKTDLAELAALLSEARLVVASSTGPLHLAVALGKEVVGLYSPSLNTLPSRWGPYNHPEWVIMPNKPICPRCYPGRFSSCACMEELTVEAVFNHIVQRIEG